MKEIITGFVICFFLLSTVNAGDIFETGLLQDKQGYIDSKTGTKVDVVANMMGMKNRKTGVTEWTQKYILVMVPIEKSTIDKVEVYSDSGELLKMASSPRYIKAYGKSDFKAGIKLYLVHRENISFKLKIYQK